MDDLKPCPSGHNSPRVIGGPGTAGGPKHWAGCDICSWRAWGDTEQQAIARWNDRGPPGRIRGGTTIKQLQDYVLDQREKGRTGVDIARELNFTASYVSTLAKKARARFLATPYKGPE